MFTNFPFFPPEASTQAVQVDLLYFFLVAVSAFFAVLIAVLIIVFAVKFHRKSEDEVGVPIHGSLILELAWTIIPLGLTMVIFVWGAVVFFHGVRPPKDSIDVYVVGKQWMWKIEHMNGAREINELHVPIGQPVKLIMGSEDVIHSFSIPAFRVKEDVIPGRYNTLWFTATKPGRYHLFCTQYCGTRHSFMVGWVVAMEPADYQAWLAGGESGTTMVNAGAKLFQDLSCGTCHTDTSQSRGPALNGVYGSRVQLTNGQSVIADDAYIRESILQPQAKIVAGYAPIMPTFQGLISEDQLLQLITYVKSLGVNPPGTEIPAQTASQTSTGTGR